MEKRSIILAGISVIAALAVIFALSLHRVPEEFLIKIQEAESSLEDTKIVSTSSFDVKYENMQIEYYSQYNYCSDAIEKVGKALNLNNKQIKLRAIEAEFFQGQNIDQQGMGHPIVILRGNADLYDIQFGVDLIGAKEDAVIIIGGVGACSEKILISSICRHMKEPLDICNEFLFGTEYKEISKSLPEDYACYEPCNIEYNLDYLDGIIVSHYWQGPPCGRAEGYNKDESSPMGRQCYSQDACKTKKSDLGCCLQHQCVYDGRCYNPWAVLDAGFDGQREVCININGTGFWANADMGEDFCGSNFKWINCGSSDCKSGADNYYGKENGLCCGDDKNEMALECNGRICEASNKNFACCPQNNCVYDGKCYEAGCSQIETESGRHVNAYCNSGRWEDLDDNYCSKCLGEKAWSGLICCGDDEGEGEYPTRFTFNTKIGSSTLSYDYCTDDRNKCVFPESDTDFEEGCYKFEKNRYFEGQYYCSKSQWYDLDNSSDFCKHCGLEWISECCGDDNDEFFIRGSDGTLACCSNDRDDVAGGECFPTVSCGNNKLEDSEECESQDSLNNEFCRQTEERCFDNRLGTRDGFGNCDMGCNCGEDEFAIACTKGNCGAECSEDSDCSYGEICDLNKCGCKEKTYCGDGIVQGKNDDNWKEECEFPGTIFNTFCDGVKQCFDAKTGIRYGYGGCTDRCQCSYEPFQKICLKGSCGAECSQDGAGCDKGEICSADTCTCIKSGSLCGDNLCEANEEYSCPIDCIKEDCPYRIDIEFDKDNYYENETMRVRVYVYDKHNNLMPNANFNLDVLVNGNYVSTFSYTTTQIGYYERTKRVTPTLQSGNYEYIAYVAKIQRSECDLVGDSANAFLYLKNPESPPVNLSKYEVKGTNITTFFYARPAVSSIKGNVSFSDCGNNLVERGEVCDGSSICRASAGCNYEKRTYDIFEVCNSCSCPIDLKSEQDDEVYCNNCNNCGDGALNCGEECETGTKEVNFCRDGRLYSGFEICTKCNWHDDGIGNDILTSNCFCECPQNPEACFNGNWIEYKESYYSGCSNGACNSCNCQDTYTKDTNKDGIEDKCSREICSNGIDDNDNGLADMKDPECSLCGNCGVGEYNLCDRGECLSLMEGCYFKEAFFNVGACSNCSSASCESYGSNSISCMQDSCSLGNCYWNGTRCCKDQDMDGICNSIDNCPDIYNPGQQNFDNDERGNHCELCVKESLLVEPSEQNEASCNDNIDNDCDGFEDCQDTDCRGIGNCCQTSDDCVQSSCMVESCINNECAFRKRNMCDNSECSEGLYCGANGNCESAEASSEVCRACILDLTQYDAGIGFGLDLFGKPTNYKIGACCGNQDNENYIIQKETGREACCDSLNDCVDSSGNCVDSNTPRSGGHSLHCWMGQWNECSGMNHVLCGEADSSYDKNIEYNSGKEAKETGWYCTYNGIWAWRNKMPNEICSDMIDNDCNGMIDGKDAACSMKANLPGK